MDRHGISFTLTIVVAGVILLMTALSIITLGGSSISQFFQTVGQEQEEAVTQSEVQEACQQKARQLQNGFCSQYVATHTVQDGSVQSVTSTSTKCNNAASNRKPVPTDPSSAEDGTYFRDGQTASSAGCDWTAYTGISPTVTVQGQTYNCVTEGYLSATCPAQ